MAPKPPAEAAPAKAALSIVGAITAALFAVAYAVSQQRHDNAPRFDPRYCEGGLRPRPAWALAQPRRFAPESPRDGAPPVCSAILPVRGAYPTTRKLEDIVASWPINDTRIQAPVGGLCRFDWSKPEDRLMALAYRRAEVPFQVFNVPSLSDAVERWSSDDYVGGMWHGAATAEVSTFPNGEFAHGPNHFMFHHAGSSARAPTTSRSTTLARWLARDGGPPEYLTFEVPYAHGGVDRRGGGARGESVLHGELPLFDAAVQSDESRFFAPSEEDFVDARWPRGIVCKGGDAGVVGAEAHWDASRNFIAQVRGTRRFILADPEEACAMNLLPRGHASHRHSAVDWSKPADQWPPELRSVGAYDVVQRPGDVLYLPQYHMHYIISLDRNLQCNSVRGRDLRETPKTRECLQLGPNFECARPATAFEVPVALLDAERGLVRACVVDFGPREAAPADFPMFSDLPRPRGVSCRVVALTELVANARWRLGGQGGRPALEPSGFVFHLSRCGSTLIANSLQTAPGALVLSEPEILAEVLARAPALLKDVFEVFGSSNYHTHMVVKFQSAMVVHAQRLAELFPTTPLIVAYRDPADILAAHFYEDKPPCAALYRPGDKLGEASATLPGGNGEDAEDAGRRCVARLAATMDAALALEDAMFVDYSELPGVIDDIAARMGLPTVNVSLVAGVDAKAGGAYKSLAATKRAALSQELWAWAAPHLSPRYAALRRR